PKDFTKGTQLHLSPSAQTMGAAFDSVPVKQVTGGLVGRILRHQLAHHRQLQQGLLEGVDAGFGVEQGMEVLGQTLPAGGEVVGVLRLAQAVEQGLHQLGMGSSSIVLLRLQPVTQRHQLIDLGDNALLFVQRGEWQRKGTYVRLVYCLLTCSTNEQYCYRTSHTLPVSYNF